MFITLRIWWWIFIAENVWHTTSNSCRLSRLRQKRFAIRLANAKEKEQLAVERKTLTGLKDWAILYRLLSRRVVYSMLMW